MPTRARNQTAKLKTLIAEQEKERKSAHVFSEKVTPRRPLLFPGLTPRQKACLILSFFLPRQEIAEVLRSSSECVKRHRKDGLKRLHPDEAQRYRRLAQGFKHQNIFHLPAQDSPDLPR